jgi:hypothetical protein
MQVRSTRAPKKRERNPAETRQRLVVDTVRLILKQG